MAVMTIDAMTLERQESKAKRYKNQPGDHPFCEEMRFKRDIMGISYRDLADRIGSNSGSYMSFIEQGRNTASVEIGLAICQILDIPIHLCLDYIASNEMKRMQKYIKEKYIEWTEYVPDNVLDKMLEDEYSLLVHNRLTAK